MFFSLLLLSTLYPNAANESDEWRYGRNKNIYCNNNKLCYCQITYNNPYSPLIYTGFINHAILGNYFYIYFTFIKPSKNVQQILYVEAKDTKLNRTVILKGDCYLLNLNENLKYELRIYKSSLDNSFIQLQFLGLKRNFGTTLEIRFPFSSDIYFNGIMLTKDNSLWKYEVNDLIDYFEQIEQKKNKQEERKTQSLGKANQILKNLFGKVLTTEVEFTNNYFTTIIPTPYFLITLSIAVGLDLSTDIIFQNEEKVISDFVVIKGNIESEKNILDFLGDNIDVNNPIKKLIEILTGQIEELIFSCDFETDSFSLTISTCPNCFYVDFTFRFFEPVNGNIFFEIEIKVEPNDKNLLKLILDLIEGFLKINEAIVEFYEKNPNLLEIVRLVIFVVGLLVLIIFTFYTGGATAPLLEKYAMGLLGFGIMKPLLEIPIFQKLPNS